jgi:tRNA(Ile)-lysidine synthetase-like protein
MELLDHFLTTLRGFDLPDSPRPILLGVSGGADSLAMLHLFWRARDDLALAVQVLHVHHGIRGAEADQDADFVIETCRAWNIPAQVVRTDAPAQAKQGKLSLEEAARQVRYAALALEAERINARAVAVAHTADDQAETVLMHLLRGSGLTGLRGMQPISPPGSHFPLPLLRPLLAFSRAEIEAYCADHRLAPRTDPSNADTTYFRNRLRHDILPLLDSVAPGVCTRLAHTAALLSADHAALEAQVALAWDIFAIEKTDQKVRFDRARWSSALLAVQREFLRQAVWHLRPAVRDVTFDHIEAALGVIRSGQTGARSTLPGGLMLTLEYDAIRIAPVDAAPASPEWPLLNQGEELALIQPGSVKVGDWTLSISRYEGERSGAAWEALIADRWSALLALPAADNLILRTRRDGDRFQPQGAGGSQKLSDFMINAKIPGAWRGRIPLLVIGDQIGWVCGWRVDQRLVVRPESGDIWLAKFIQPGSQSPALET